MGAVDPHMYRANPQGPYRMDASDIAKPQMPKVDLALLKAQR